MSDGLPFHPDAASVLFCDFEGNVAPEIIKNRPVVVICKMKRKNLVMVVPLSSRAPDPQEKYHFKLKSNPIPQTPGAPPTESWAKCDLVTTVRLARLDRVKVGRGRAAKWLTVRIGLNDLEEIRKCVGHAVGLTLLPTGSAETQTGTSEQTSPPAINVEDSSRGSSSQTDGDAPPV